MTDQPFIVAHVTDGNAFVVYAQSSSRAAALRRRKKLMEDNPARALRVIERTGDREYRDVTDDQPEA